MIKQLKGKFKDLLMRDPWLIAKYVIVTIMIGAIGKVMLVGAKDGADLSVVYAQFVPTLPIMGLSFLAHKYLWEHQETSLRSHIGGCWSASYGAQFFAGHGLFVLFAVLLGWQYIVVSVVIGVVSSVVTFSVNEWKIFRRQLMEAEIA